MHTQDLFAATDIRQRHHHLAVEAARAQQRGVEHVGAVGSGDHDDAGGAFEAVHLDQQLVERLLALVVTPTEACATLAADGIDLVDEDDAWRLLLGLLEHVAHASGAHANEHFDEIGTGDAEERYLGLAGNGLGQQRFTGTRRADHEHAFRDAATELLELGRIAQEFDQLGDFFLGFVTTGHVGEGDGVGRVVEHARARLAERERTATPAALHLAHEEYPHTNEQQHREPRQENLREEGLSLVGLGRPHLDAILHQIGHHPDIAARGIHRQGVPVLRLGVNGLAFDLHFGNAPGFGLLHEFRVGHRLLSHRPMIELVEHRHQHDANHHPDRKVFEEIIQRNILDCPTGL